MSVPLPVATSHLSACQAQCRPCSLHFQQCLNYSVIFYGLLFVLIPQRIVPVKQKEFSSRAFKTTEPYTVPGSRQPCLRSSLARLTGATGPGMTLGGQPKQEMYTVTSSRAQAAPQVRDSASVSKGTEMLRGHHTRTLNRRTPSFISVSVYVHVREID